MGKPIGTENAPIGREALVVDRLVQPALKGQKANVVIAGDREPGSPEPIELRLGEGDVVGVIRAVQRQITSDDHDIRIDLLDCFQGHLEIELEKGTRAVEMRVRKLRARPGKG